MKVRSFMIPAAKVITCDPGDTLAVVTEKMLKHNIGSIIIMPVTDGGTYPPMGIVTKTDLLRGWQQGLDLNTATAVEVMGTAIETVLDTDSKDMAAAHFEKTKHRHAFVFNAANEYVGLIGSLDIAVECSKDSKAWPYMNRDELAEKYKVPIKSPTSPKSPTCATKPPVPHNAQARRTFLGIAGVDV